MNDEGAFARHGAEVSEADRAAILAAAHDYYEGWLAGDADRLASCLHPDARKRAAVEPGSTRRELDELDIPRWLERVRVRGPIRDVTATPDYILLDVFRDVATCLVLSEPFMDYLHIARFGHRWLLVNVLYQER